MARHSLYGGFRPVAIALIVENGNGERMLMGSRCIRSAELEISLGHTDRVFDGDYTRYTRLPQYDSYRIEAECRDLVVHHTVSVPCPPQIGQRGIYLPDMSFRALPSPEES